MRIVVCVESTTGWGERRQLDIENIDQAARELLGHKNANITTHYSERGSTS